MVERISSRDSLFNSYSWKAYRSFEFMPPLHVHGTTGFGMALGVNDETQLKYDIFVDDEPEYKQQIIKPIFNESMGEGVEAETVEVLNKSDVIYIYGMSLGATDRRWWERILNHMNDYPSVILIIYNTSIAKRELMATHHNIEARKFRDSFLGYCQNKLSDEEKKIFAIVSFSQIEIALRS